MSDYPLPEGWPIEDIGRFFHIQVETIKKLEAQVKSLQDRIKHLEKQNADGYMVNYHRQQYLDASISGISSFKMDDHGPIPWSISVPADNSAQDLLELMIKNIQP